MYSELLRTSVALQPSGATDVERGRSSTPSSAPRGLRITLSSSDLGTAVVLVGELDLATAPLLAEALATVSGALDIDCRALTFIDAVGVAVLLQASGRTGSVRLRQPSPLTRNVIAVLGLASIFFDGDDPHQSSAARSPAPFRRRRRDEQPLLRG